MKQTATFFLTFTVLVLGGAGVSTAQEGLPPRPTIYVRTVADDATHEGVLSEWCWPVAADDIDCGALPDQPEEVILVQNGDIISIVIEGEAGPPGELGISFLDDLDDQGQPIRVTFEQPGDPTEWVVNLDEGDHVALVEAVFPQVADLSYLYYLFTFQVGEPEPEETETPMATAATPMAEEPGQAPTVTLIPAIDKETAEPTGTPPAAEAIPTAELWVGPPAITLESAGVIYAPLAVSYCWDNPAGERECPADQVTEQPSDRLTLSPLGAFLTHVDGPAPDKVDLVLLSSDGIQELERESRRSDVLFLYSPLIPEPGGYVFAVEAEWPQGTAIFYFQILIVEEQS
jgi:hypothetical protein